MNVKLTQTKLFYRKQKALLNRKFCMLSRAASEIGLNPSKVISTMKTKFSKISLKNSKKEAMLRSVERRSNVARSERNVPLQALLEQERNYIIQNYA